MASRAWAGGALRRLRRHRVPTWWSDAKLGIFIHWTPASVPAWAPTDEGIGERLASGRNDALAENPYSEWYQNSLRFPDSTVSRHHRATYGDRPYESFAAEFEAGLAGWDPEAWAGHFRDAGAGYVVLVAKHHDGWCLWPTEVTNPHRAGWHSSRDIVGELAAAVRGVGLRFGIYYSGGLDWTFCDHPIGTFSDLIAAVPGGDYPEYAEAQVRELIDRYRPSVLWNDIAWPTGPARLWRLFEDYYTAVPDGVVNDRWMPRSASARVIDTAPVRRLIDMGVARASRSEGDGGGLVPPKPPHFDVRTPEYVSFDRVQPTAWECVRGIDRSFGYNANSSPEHFLAHGELLDMVADIVATGGNLLLNVGPRGADATIPDEQLTRLRWLGEWASTGGAGIFDSRPWVRPKGRSDEGTDLRFWARGEQVWVAELTRSQRIGEVLTVPGVRPTPTTSVTDVDGGSLRWSWTGSGIVVRTGSNSDASADMTVICLDRVDAV